MFSTVQRLFALIITALAIQSVLADPSPSSIPRRRRQLNMRPFMNRDGTLNCATGLTSCPISITDERHECVNTKTDLDNCGGCAAQEKGVVCGKQDGVRTASCNTGTCVITTCRSGYSLDPKDQTCKKNSN